jgi:enamine deaminase RidA (YjgF/YER057c/UK114 family)
MKTIGVLALCALAAFAGPFDKKKKKSDEDVTQVLQLPKDPPSAVVAETARLGFYVSPLSSKGLLSQQVRDALKALHRNVGGANIVKLRAFVAGSGDMRRVQAIVSETFTERHLSLPALSVVQVGGLPLEGAQVVIEATSVGKRDVNPNGLVFIAGQQAASPGLEPVMPLLERSLAGLRTAVRAAGSQPEDVVRGTCFLSSLDGFGKIRDLVESEYRGAAWNFVQTQRAPVHSVVECEAVARPRLKIQKPVEFLNPDGLTKSPNYSQIALVGAPRIAFTGTQVAFGFQAGDARLAFGRLQKELAAVGASIKEVAWSSIYPLSPSIADEVRKIRFEYYDLARPPASTLLPFEGLPSMDASFAVDAIAVVSR